MREPLPLPANGDAGQSEGPAIEGSSDAGRDGGTAQPNAADAGVMEDSCRLATPPKEGLKLWLRAGVALTLENGRVAAWADQSGGPLATMDKRDQRPSLVANALNGKPALRFTGGREAWQRILPINGLTHLTIAFVNATPNLWKDDINEWCHRQDCNTSKPTGVRVTSETGCSGTYQHVLWWNGNGDWTGVYLSPKQEEIAFRFGNGQKTYSENAYNIVHDTQVAWPRPRSVGTDFSYTVAIHDKTSNRLFVHGEKVSETRAAGNAP